MKNSWYLIVSLDKFGQITKDAMKIISEEHIQICKCGVWFIKEQNPLFTIQNGYDSPKCQSCGNEKFIFCTMQYHFHKSLYEPFDPFKYSNFEWNYSEAIIGNAYHAYANLILPTVDLLNSKIVFKRKKIMDVSIDQNGEIQKNIHNELPWGLEDFYIPITKQYTITNSQSNKNNIFQILDKKLVRFILRKPFKKFKTVGIFSSGEYKKIQNLDEIKFFMQYPGINTMEILRWDLFEEIKEALKNFKSLIELLKFVINYKKEKSIRRALYLKYENCIKRGSIYNPRIDFVFSRTIDNVDLLAKVIGFDSTKMESFKWKNSSDAIWLIMFLKKFYREKSIISLFMKNDLVFDYWKDIFTMVSQNKEAIKKYFKKVKCNVKSIHDEISLSIKKDYAKKRLKIFQYTKDIVDTQTNIDKFTFKLPHDNYELFEWSMILNNCLFSYETNILNSSSIIYGIFVGKKLKYVMEIYKNLLFQISGYNNSIIPPEDMKIINIWLKKNNIEPL